MAIKIEAKVKHVHSGFRGVVTARCEHASGHVELCVQPLVKAGGEYNSAIWCHEGDLATVKSLEKENPADDADEGDDEDGDEKPAKKGKKSKDEDESEDEDESDDEDETEDSDEDESEDEDEDESEDEDEDEEDEKPKKKSKLTIDDVNDACKKRAARSSVAETLSLLKKNFKVKSVSKLKPEQYAQAIKVLSKK